MKLSTKKNDGVSPVIGTILLVAITVVLVAIISAVVMGMTGGIGTTHTVGIQVANDADAANNVSITFLSGDVSALQSLTVYNTTGTAVTLDESFTIGKAYSAKVADAAGSQTVTVVGTFSDGNQTLVKQTIIVS